MVYKTRKTRKTNKRRYFKGSQKRQTSKRYRKMYGGAEAYNTVTNVNGINNNNSAVNNNTATKDDIAANEIMEKDTAIQQKDKEIELLKESISSLLNNT